MPAEKITSPKNPKIKNLRRLEKASERKEQQLILIEGLREVVLAHRAGYEIKEIFLCEENLKTDKEYSLSEIRNPSRNESVGQAKSEIRNFEITQEVYESLAYRDSTEGIIATAIPKKHSLENLLLRKNSLVLVIESVEKPGNLGAMLRTADAAGVDAVIICDSKTDLYNQNVIRSSIGTIFTNRIAVCETPEAVKFIKEKKIKSYAAEPGAEKFYYEQDLRGATAIIVGTEATGLSDAWRTAADEKIKIPMLGKIDSLNVSVSAGILLFEAIRQRKSGIR